MMCFVNGSVRSLLVGSAALTAILASPAFAQSETKTSTSSASIPEIIVTAQKRSQRLQDVPISVTAIGGDQLKTLQVDSGTEIARQAPNLRVSNLGNEDQPKFSIRGISTPDFNLNTTSPVGVFYDEVYLGAQWMGGPQTFDLERVEVLRGPQGTLFGKNTTAGAINFISRAPSFGDTSGYISGEYGDNSYYHVGGAGETQLIQDKLAVRVAFNVTSSDGWVKNYYQSASAKNLSSIDNHAIRVTTSYRDSADDFDATLRLFTSDSRPTNIGIIAYGLGPGGVEGDGINPRINPYTGRPFNVHEGAYDHNGNIRAASDGGYLTMNKGLGSNFTATSITSYVNGQFDNTVDADGSYVPSFAIDFFAAQYEITQDLRVASHFKGPFNFILGGYYDADRVNIATNYFTGVPPAPAAPTIGVPLFTQNYAQRREQYAGYLDATYNITPSLQLFAGARWTHDHGEVNNFNTTVAAFIGAPGINVPFLEYNKSITTGRAGINYHFTPDLMVYAQWSRGYRSPAFNGGALIIGSLNIAKPEFLDNTEIGVKSEWFEHRLELNASAFHYSYKNQQFLVALTLPGGVGFNSSETNADARTWGGEIEMNAKPIANLSLTAGLGLLDAEYTSGTVPDAFNNIIPIKGHQVIEAPRLTANMAADYTIPASDETRFVIHGDVTHASSENFRASSEAASRSDGFWEANARVSFTDDAKHYELAFWMKNLTDNTVPTGIVYNPSTGNNERFTTIPYPRRYGFEIAYHFE